jgi:hypothetical protein
VEKFASSYGESDEVVGRVGTVGDAGVRDDLDAVHGVDEQAAAARGRDGDVGARAAEDVDGDGRLHGLGAGGDRHQHLHSAAAAATHTTCYAARRDIHDGRKRRETGDRTSRADNQAGEETYLLDGRRRRH